jgi:signal peptidase II
VAEEIDVLPKTPGLRSPTRWGLIAYAIAAAVIVLDQLSKYWVLTVAQLQDKGPIQVAPMFQLTMVWNPGVSFGLLRADSIAGRWILVAFAAAIVAALAVWARRVDRALTAVALGLVMGGAAGNNLIDRVRFGAVADFLDFHRLYFPWVFNVADSAISVGVALLLLDSFLRREPAPAT